MRFRTKLFLTSSSIVLLLWAGAWWPIQRLISGNFDRMTTDNFTATRQSLQSLQAEQVNHMRQAAGMVMNIPELRSLIAESQVEITSDNLASLQDRLDGLLSVVDSKFICVLDGRGSLIAQNSTSPWHNLDELRAFIAGTPQAKPFVSSLFQKPTKGSAQQYGLWIYQGRLYQVVGLPLLFSTDVADEWHPDGALIMATPVTADLATSLAKSHNCEVSFLSANKVLASSLSPTFQTSVLNAYSSNSLPTSRSFSIELGDTKFSSYLEPLIDPGSKTLVGATLIQDSQADTSAMQRGISLSLLAIMSTGLLLTGFISFLVSGAITKPVHKLVKAVERVASGDMESSIQLGRRDEIGQLATAFNDMVVQLRHRHELQQQVDESQAATKAKSQFLANMSHEIRTPLNGVIGVANLLLATPLNDRQRHYAQLVRSSTEVLTTLINDILDFSKIEAGKLDLESVEFNLRNIVDDVVELLSQKAFGKGVEMAASFDAGVPTHVVGDPNRLRQVLMNLIGNAVKFTDNGEIILRIGCHGSHIRFAVSDTGPGIPEDRIERLFKSFSQVDASTTRRYGGTGLGLAISKELAELMSGAIGVESNVGQGSTFWFTAYLAAVTAEQTTERLPVPVRALILHSSKSICEAVKGQLLTAGIQSGIATTTGEALQLLHQQSFKILLIDQSFDALADTALPQLRISTPQAEISADQLLDRGFVAQIIKPIRNEELINAVKQSLADLPMATTATTTAHPAKTTTKSARILLAEDNQINQIVASDLLTNAGHRVEVVGDGRNAVARAREQQFDVILMDCQMPEMDGLEATRQIRELELQNTNGRRVPIIALTANASGVGRQRCTEAGMDGYCPKPFRPADLLGMIADLLGEERVRPTENSVVELNDDPLQLDTLLDSCTNNSTLVIKILNKFDTQIRDASGQFEKAFAKVNASEVARLSHALRGTAGIVGANILREKLTEIETLGRSDALESADKQLAELQLEIDRCTAFIPIAIAQLEAR